MIDSPNQTIISKGFQFRRGEKQCDLRAVLSIQEITQTEELKKKNGQDGTATKEGQQRHPMRRDEFIIEYLDEYSYFLDGNNEIGNRLFLVTLDISQMIPAASDGPQPLMVGEDDLCFAPLVKAKFVNKRKSEWVMRFKAYSTFYLVWSGLTVGLSAAQYEDINKIDTQSRVNAKQMALVGPLLFTSWSIATLVFHFMMALALDTMGMMFELLPILAIAGVVVFNYLILMKMIEVRNYKNLLQDVHYYVCFLSFVLLLMMPRLLTDSTLCYEVFGLIWIPQIFWNLRTHRHW